MAHRFDPQGVAVVVTHKSPALRHTGDRRLRPFTGVCRHRRLLGPAFMPGRQGMRGMHDPGPFTGLVDVWALAHGTRPEQEPRERGWTQNTIFGVPATRRKRRA